MKRIDKPGASQVEAAQAETRQAQTMAQTMQAAWAEAWGQQLNRSGEIYGQLFAGMRDEFAAFMQKRLEANMEAARAWTACRSVNEALELQQSWLRCAIEHYGDQGTKMSELCRSAVFHTEPEAAQRAPEEAKPAPKPAPERGPAHEPVHTQVQRAAE